MNRMRGIESSGKNSRILGRNGVDLSGRRAIWSTFPVNDVSHHLAQRVAEKLMIAKAIPKSWTDMPKPLDWAAGAVPAPMSANDAASDLAKMDVSHPSTLFGSQTDSSHVVITLPYPSLTPARALHRDTQLHQPIPPIHLPLHHTLSTQKKVSNIPNTSNEFQPHQHHITQYIV